MLPPTSMTVRAATLGRAPQELDGQDYLIMRGDEVPAVIETV